MLRSMPRTRKNTVHCRKIAAHAAARACAARTSSVPAPEDSSESETDEDIQIEENDL